MSLVNCSSKSITRSLHFAKNISSAISGLWHKIVSKYSSFDGIEFPVEITIEHGSNIFQLKFSKCVINSGLTDSDLSFNIPSSAEEAFIEKRR